MRWPAKTGTVVGDGESRKGRGRRLGSTGNGEKMKGKKKFAELQYDYSTRCSSFRKLRLQEEFTSSSKSFVREVYEFSSFFLFFFCVFIPNPKQYEESKIQLPNRRKQRSFQEKNRRKQ